MSFTKVFSRFALASAMTIFASAVAFAQTETPPPAPLTDEYGIPLKLESSKKVTASLKINRAKAKFKKIKSAAPQVFAPEQLENQAVKELLLPKEDLSTGVLSTPATVRSRVEQVKNPVRPLAYRLGVSFQPFTPQGTMPVGDLVPYDLSQAGMGAMVAIEGQWLPFVTTVTGLQAGAFASVGFAQFNLALRSPAGISIDSTKLSIVKFQLGGTASYQLPRSPLWSAHGSVGLGRLMEIQSSPSSSYANSSEYVDFASLGLTAERSLMSLGLSGFSVYVGYDLRLALNRSTAGADVPNHSVLLGLLGNFE